MVDAPSDRAAAVTRSSQQLQYKDLQNHDLSMSSPPQEQPHLVSLVLQSKKALQHGEQLCSRAHAISNSSAKAVIDVLALDAKVRWVANAVSEQLKLVTTVAQGTEERRSTLENQLQEWDTLRNQRTNALDSILESLGTQHVPPDFHSTGTDSPSSSLFGFQQRDEAADNDNDPYSASHAETGDSGGLGTHIRSPSSTNITHSPSSTIRLPRSPVLHSPARSRRGSHANTQRVGIERQPTRTSDRSKWKTLRDFVDDAAIEELYESIEEDRVQLEKTMSQTDQYPETLRTTIEIIRSSLPPLAIPGSSFDPPSSSNLLSPLATSPSSLPPSQTPSNYRDDPPSTYPPIISTLTAILTQQDSHSNEMAVQLESLTAHYGNMAQALQESEEAAASRGAGSPGINSSEGGAGIGTDTFSEEDLAEMNRDTEELPVILGELEDSCEAIEIQHDKLLALNQTSKTQLSLLSQTITDLFSLGSIMEEMIALQATVSDSSTTALSALHERLETLVHLKEQYVSYQVAFNKLVLELARRRQYREAAENIVRGMIGQLQDMSEEENQVRQSFNSSYGVHLPEDICLCVGNSPAMWDVIPREGHEAWEFLPEIEETLIGEARERINANLNGSTEGMRQEEARAYTP